MNKQLFAVSLLIGLSVSYLFLSKKNDATRTKPAVDSVLVVGTNAQFPPYESLQEGKIVGFDIDLITEVSKRMGRDLILKDLDFDMLLLEAQVGNIQLIAAALTPTPERAEKLFFTQPYAGGDPLVIITRAQDTISGIDDLKGKEVVVNEGFTADRYVSAHEGIVIKRLSTVADAFLSLSLDRAFAFVSAQSAVEPFFKQYDKAAFNIVELPVLEEYAFAISKRYPELVEPVQKALEEIKQDGTLEKIKVAWGIL